MNSVQPIGVARYAARGAGVISPSPRAGTRTPSKFAQIAGFSYSHYASKYAVSDEKKTQICFLGMFSVTLKKIPFQENV